MILFKPSTIVLEPCPLLAEIHATANLFGAPLNQVVVLVPARTPAFWPWKEQTWRRRYNRLFSYSAETETLQIPLPIMQHLGAGELTAGLLMEIQRARGLASATAVVPRRWRVRSIIWLLPGMAALFASRVLQWSMRDSILLFVGLALTYIVAKSIHAHRHQQARQAAPRWFDMAFYLWVGIDTEADRNDLQFLTGWLAFELLKTGRSRLQLRLKQMFKTPALASYFASKTGSEQERIIQTLEARISDIEAGAVSTLL